MKSTKARLFARTLAVFVNPRRILPKVAKEGEVWFPILLVSLVLIVSQILMFEPSSKRAIETQVVEEYSHKRDLSYDAAAREIDSMLKVVPVIIIVSSPIYIVGNILILSLLITVLFKRKEAPKVPFISIFNVVGWVNVISILQMGLLVLSKTLRPESTLQLHLGALFPETLRNSFAYLFASHIDVFLIWQIWLVSIGVAYLYKRNLQNAVSIIGTVYIIFIAINSMMNPSKLGW